MADPVPKAAGQRRRRNVVVGAKKLVSAGGFEHPLPIIDPHPRTVVWWDRAWRSPMAGVWIEADLAGLERLAELMERVYRGDQRAMTLVEVRQLEDRYGFSTLARRRLQWEVSQLQPDEQAVVVEDDGRWLRAVSD